MEVSSAPVATSTHMLAAVTRCRKRTASVEPTAAPKPSSAYMTPMLSTVSRDTEYTARQPWAAPSSALSAAIP